MRISLTWRKLLLKVVLLNKSRDDFETDFDFHFKELKFTCCKICKSVYLSSPSRFPYTFVRTILAPDDVPIFHTYFHIVSYFFHFRLYHTPYTHSCTPISFANTPILYCTRTATYFLHLYTVKNYIRPTPFPNFNTIHVLKLQKLFNILYYLKTFKELSTGLESNDISFCFCQRVT